MVPRRGRFSGKVEYERIVVAADVAVTPEGEAEVQDRRLQNDAVDRHARLLQHVDERRRARRPVAFAVEELRRVPTPERREITLDELRECRNVGVNAEKRLRRTRA